jgi:hypothetical protein
MQQKPTPQPCLGLQGHSRSDHEKRFKGQSQPAGQWERILPPPRLTRKYCYIPNLNSVPGFLFLILMATMKTP